MHEAHLLRELVVLLGLAALGAAAFERMRLPSIAGFLVIGTIAGPGGLGLASDPVRESGRQVRGSVWARRY